MAASREEADTATFLSTMSGSESKGCARLCDTAIQVCTIVRHPSCCCFS
ncbi:MAG: hypothetical protein K6D59_08835 [Bacteroidales bacterium]|nr:hypothetical protein [Bacteroidales bacterium]